MLRRWPRLIAVALVGLAGCAHTPDIDAPKVNLAGVESLPGEGMEVRMAVKLRIQNPNDVALAYDGVALTLELRDMDFANGVSDAKGSVPRFGEAVVVVPVTVSAWAMARQAYTFAMGDRSKIRFVARGKLGGGLAATYFSADGEFDLPAGLAEAAPRARN